MNDGVVFWHMETALPRANWRYMIGSAFVVLDPVIGVLVLEHIDM
jgi:hypothetical protein